MSVTVPLQTDANCFTQPLYGSALKQKQQCQVLVNNILFVAQKPTCLASGNWVLLEYGLEL